MREAFLIREQDIGPTYTGIMMFSRMEPGWCFSARGDISSPCSEAEHGATRAISLRTSNADEDHPAWSPDGKLIAYTTDASGEQQIAHPLVRKEGLREVLTHFPRGYFYAPRWSPAGDHLIFADNEHRLWVMAVAGGEPQEIAQDPIRVKYRTTPGPDPVGRWLEMSSPGANQQSGIWLYNLDTLVSPPGSAIRARMISIPCSMPRAGKYLYFISTRHAT